MLEEYIEGTGPLDPEMPVILSTGPLSGVYPTCTKTVALFRSPLNGELGESYAGGHLAMSMRYSGYETIVIKGASRTLCMWQFMTIRLLSGMPLPYGIFLQQLTWEKSSESRARSRQAQYYTDRACRRKGNHICQC